MPSFGFYERREIVLPNTTIQDHIPPAATPAAPIYLTGTLCLDPANESSDAYAIAVLYQASLSSSELAQLRFGAVPEKEHLAYLTETAKRRIHEKLRGPRIGDVGVMADLPGNGNEVVYEHLVIRDLGLAPFVGEDDDVAAAMGRKPDGHQGLRGGSGQGRIVSHAQWEFRPRDWVEGWQREEEERKKSESMPARPYGTNVALVEEFQGKVNAMWVNLMRGKEHYLLNGIGTLPSHAGKGLDEALISWIFPRADREGRICFLCASPMGYGLYKKLGFEEVGGPGSVIEIDRGEWGGSGLHRHVAMVRYPTGWTGSLEGGLLR